MNSKRCRTCLKPISDQRDSISLFSSDTSFFDGKKLLFADMLKLISGENEISKSDQLPKEVCRLCISTIRSCYYFHLEVHRSLEILRSEFVTVKQEPTDTQIALILSPRHVGDETFGSDMLDEIPNYQTNDSDQEIIDYEPLEEDADEEQIQEESTSSLKVCDVCSRTFGSAKALASHRRCHQVSRGDDQEQNDTVGSKNALVCLNRLDDFHECVQCFQKFASKDALYRHHADCDCTCIECGLKIAQPDMYFNHLSTVHSIKISKNNEVASIECPFCFLSFHDRAKIQEHIQLNHPDENSVVDSISEAGESTSNDGFVYQCQACPARFHSLKGLNQHKSLKHSSSVKTVTTSSGNETNKNVIKYSRDEFLEKFLVKKSKDFYRCIPCKKEIGIRSVVLHMRSKHAAIRSFRCELCSEAFFRADYRQRHVASHHPHSFKCSSCNIQFDRAHKIDSHNHSYHNIPIKNTKPEEGQDAYDLSPNVIKYIENSKNYDYSDDMMLLQPQMSINNASSSTNDGPVSKDEFCDRNISYVSDKIVHCNVCQQDIQKNSLISHLLWKHSVDKPLKCPFCSTRVVKNNARLLHMAKCHPNQYKCVDCKIQFVKHQNLADHSEEVHGKTCLIAKSSGEMEDLQLNEMRFVTNKNEDEAIEHEIMNEITSFNAVEQGERKYDCPHCPKSFTSPKNLLIHKSHKHRNEGENQEALNTTDQQMTYEEFCYNCTEEIDESSVKCIVCDQTINKKNLVKHLKSRHCLTAAYLCEICPHQFYRPEDRLQHFSSQHRGIFFCETCNIQFICNSRYAKHMKDVHEIEMESSDQIEVDINVCDLRFVASIRQNLDATHDSVDNISYRENEEEDNEENIDPMEEMMQQISNNEGMSRTEFIKNYFRNVNKDTKYCTACEKNFQASSLYHHLIHSHATIFPFKCSHCELRLERSSTRARHMQVFHPNEYMCNYCGIQFQKHAKFVDHMLIEHNEIVTSEKGPFEEEDISTADLRYIAYRPGDSSMWQDDEMNSSNNSMMAPYYYQQSTENEGHQEMEDGETSSSVKNEEDKIPALLQEIAIQQYSDESGSYGYQDFKDKFMKNIDGVTFECIPCKRTIIRTSVCAHLRLWHASKMMFNCELCPLGFRRHDYRQRHMASSHPQDFICTKCNVQFYRSALYVDHMKNSHKISLSIIELKTKDEIDVPLESLTFDPHVPESERIHPDERNIRPKRRLSIALDERPINPMAGGSTFRDFCSEHIREEGSFMRCLPCNEKVSKLSLKKHLKKYHATSRPYNCEQCDESFSRIDERTNHMKMIHPNSNYCRACDKQFYMSIFYTEHMRETHGQIIKQPIMKGKTDVDVPIERLRFVAKKDGIPNHRSTLQKKIEEYSHISDDAEMTREQFTKKFLRAMKLKTGEPQTRCIACHKIFSSKNRYFHVLHNHVTMRPFGCEFCPMRFFTSFKRIKHMNLKHPNDLTCTVCLMQFERSMNYSVHMKEEHEIIVDVSAHDECLDVPSEKLRYTKKSTSIRLLLKGHQKECESDLSNDFNSSMLQEWNCNVCKIEFDSSRSYRQHMRDHGTSSEIIIKKEDTPKSEIKLIPSEPKECNFSCNLCEKKFLTKFALNAHKKFKHGINGDGSTINSKKKTEKQIKFDVECEMCKFTSFRRDYVEHHIKQVHKGEFLCGLCSRQLSNYNYFVHHMSTHTFETDQEEKTLKALDFSCSYCSKRFKLEKSKIDHENSRHGEGEVTDRKFFCVHCNVNYHSKANYEIHLEGYKHKSLQSFLEEYNGTPAIQSTIKQETTDLNPPESKKPRLDTSNSSLESIEDKLDYLKYLEQLQNGNYRCGICGKTKLSRKFLLHHLKQHEEVPTFDCNQCPERFVFKRKYDKHMKMHGNGSQSNEKEIIVNEHPKFQDSLKSSPPINCPICNVTFKLTIMLNKHNSTWHSDENPNKNLAMHEQKQRNKESVIKLHRCCFCSDTYHKLEKLADHLKAIHSAIVSDENKYICFKCNLSFDEPQFLENHQKLFCIHRMPPPSTAASLVKDVKETVKIINEQ